MREHFGDGARGFFVFNGTGANVASIDALTRPWEAVICTDVAHMHVDECGAPERLAGVKLLTVAHRAGQARRPPTSVNGRRGAATSTRRSRGWSRSPSRRELGTVYSLAETRAIADAAHELGMYLHVDGARLANAAAALDAGARRADHRGRASTWSPSAGPRTASSSARRSSSAAPSSPTTSPSPASSSGSWPRRCASSPPSSRRCSTATCGCEAPRTRTRWRPGWPAAVGPIDGVEISHPVEANAVFARLAAAGDRPAARGAARRPSLLRLGRGERRGALDVRVGHEPRTTSTSSPPRSPPRPAEPPRPTGPWIACASWATRRQPTSPSGSRRS